MRRVLVVILLLAPSAACANPVIVNPVSLISFWVVALSALAVEAGVVALLLLFSGLAPLRVFLALLLANLAIFTFGFYPLARDHLIPLPMLEGLIVAADGLAIKLMAGFDAFQSGDFRGLSWLRAAVISLLGNATSFFIGIMASGSPWESHGMPLE